MSMQAMAEERSFAVERQAPPYADGRAKPLAERRAKALDEAIAYATDLIPPLWPLADFVAVNPFIGLIDRKFLDARAELRRVRTCETLPSNAWLAEELRSGRISQRDVEAALRRCKRDYPQSLRGWTVEKADCLVRNNSDRSVEADRDRLELLSERVDPSDRSDIARLIQDAVSRFCAAHFDEGQALWPSPWKGVPLYAAWRSAARFDRRMETMGVIGFRRFVERLPESPNDSIAASLRILNVPVEAWPSVLAATLFSLSGWASFLKRVEADKPGEENLLGLLALRLAYEAALAERHPVAAEAWAKETTRSHWLRSQERHGERVLARYVVQTAAECALQRRLLQQIVPTSHVGQAPRKRSLAQMVFCIDVRSETLRRHIEACSDEACSDEAVETFGFAGFFGIACRHLPIGESDGPAQCPALLKPAYAAVETATDERAERVCEERRRAVRLLQKVWKKFQTSALSCFSFVETTGIAYAGKLLGDSLRWTRPAPSPARDGVSGVGIELRLTRESRELTSIERTDLAENVLRNLGLVRNFARFVVFCGHGSEVTNNPYKAGLDCGACGGHAGEPNARVAASLLNDPQVRRELETRGIFIPDDVRFVAALHETVSDQLRFFACDLPEADRGDFERLRSIVGQASETTRAERSRRTSSGAPADALRRGKDWSEVRPEWGLAGNAAFIAARRCRTQGRSLGTTCFLHSYDYSLDREERTLELILSAPVVVASWINLQYYASTVDNFAFGSGDKTIQDVVGRIGVLSGNGGDLRTGLPWQSIHDGSELQHDPLRLFVLVEAPRGAIDRTLQKHPSVNDLFANGWASLGSLEGDEVYLRSPEGNWELRQDSIAATAASLYSAFRCSEESLA